MDGPSSLSHSTALHHSGTTHLMTVSLLWFATSQTLKMYWLLFMFPVYKNTQRGGQVLAIFIRKDNVKDLTEVDQVKAEHCSPLLANTGEYSLWKKGSLPTGINFAKRPVCNRMYCFQEISSTLHSVSNMTKALTCSIPLLYITMTTSSLGGKVSTLSSGTNGTVTKWSVSRAGGKAA